VLHGTTADSSIGKYFLVQYLIPPYDNLTLFDPKMNALYILGMCNGSGTVISVCLGRTPKPVYYMESM
jgi:hypothetical protein